MNLNVLIEISEKLNPKEIDSIMHIYEINLLHANKYSYVKNSHMFNSSLFKFQN